MGLPSELKARLILPSYKEGIMNAMRQGKPKFEALNNCNSFELDWDRDSNNLLLTSSEEIYLYQQADKSWKESLIA